MPEHDFTMNIPSPINSDTAATIPERYNSVREIVKRYENKYKAYQVYSLGKDQTFDKKTHVDNNVQQEILIKSNVKKMLTMFSNPTKTGINDVNSKTYNADIDSEIASNAFDTNMNNAEGELITSFSLKNQEGKHWKRRRGLCSTLSKINIHDFDNELMGTSKSDEKGRKQITLSSIGTNDLKYREDVVCSSPVKDTDSQVRQNSEDYDFSMDLEMQGITNSYRNFHCNIFDFEEEDQRSTVQETDPFLRLERNDTQNVENAELNCSELNKGSKETLLFDISFDRDIVAIFKDSANHRECGPDMKLSPKSAFDSKLPQLIEAYLKEPIESQDMNWASATGRKSTRRKSLNKLLTNAKKYLKKSKGLFNEKKLRRKPRELQDSGYDEENSSPPSSSYSDVYYEKLVTTPTFKTFRPKDITECSPNYLNPSPSIGKCQGRLLLSDVPQDEFTTDLEISYPTSSIQTLSLNRKFLHETQQLYAESLLKVATISDLVGSMALSDYSRLPKHPHLSRSIPKHPFVSMSKMDETQCQTICNKKSEQSSQCKELVFQHFHLVSSEIMDCSSLFLDNSCKMPRSHLWKSVPQLNVTASHQAESSSHNEALGRSTDLMRADGIRKTTSSFNVNLLPSVYSCTQSKPCYATVKPRNWRYDVSGENAKLCGSVQRCESI